MAGPVGEIIHINASKNDALLLFFMIAKYQHGLQENEFKLAMPRLKLEFEKFERWLQVIHGVSLK